MDVREMLPLTYDQSEFFLILLCGPGSFLVSCIPAETPEWVIETLMVIIMPLQIFIEWSLSVRPASREFFFWYLGLWP